MVKGLQARIHAMIGRLNGKYSRLSSLSPAVHISTRLPFEDLCALYALADIALVTPVCSGINPVGQPRWLLGGWVSRFVYDLGNNTTLTLAHPPPPTTHPTRRSPLNTCCVDTRWGNLPASFCRSSRRRQRCCQASAR